MNVVNSNNKHWFYEKVLRELEKLTINGFVIPYPLIFQKLSWMFHLTKEESRQLLREMKEKDMIEFCGLRGIRICRKTYPELTLVTRRKTTFEKMIECQRRYWDWKKI